MNKGETYSLFADIDFTTDEYMNALPDDWANAQTEVLTQTATSFEILITLADEKATQIRFTYSEADAPDDMTPESALQNGYFKLSDIPENNALPEGMFMPQATDEEVYGIIFENTSKKVLEEAIYKPAKKSLITYGFEILTDATDHTGAMDAASGLLEVYGFGKTVVDYYGRNISLEEARSSVYSSNMTAQERESALSRINFAQGYSTFHAVLKLASPLIETALTPALTPAGAKLAVTVLKFASGCILDSLMLDVEHLAANQAGVGSLSFRWAIDPSGYIYDISTNERLEGAKTTLYYKENEIDTPILWDALEYEQVNPLFTDGNGCYAWDVPEGLWQVRVEKEGYINTQSEWLEVPPPQLDVNIGMLSVNADIKISSIELSPKTVSMDIGKTAQLTSHIQPANASNKSLKWSSDNASIASVDSKGLVKANKVGKCIITVESTDGSNKKAICNITVVATNVSVSGVTLNKTSATINTGKTVTLTPTIKPANATNKAVNWSTSNGKVVTVANGAVKGIGPGTATITATVADGSGVKASCTVTVKQPVTGVAFKTAAYTLTGNKKTYTLNKYITVSPSNTSNKALTWKSSSPSTVHVDKNGKITAKKASGKATITATAKDGSGKKSTITVHIGKKVSKVSLNKTKVTLTKPNKTVTLKATVAPSTAKYKKVKWTSSNNKVATVSSSGKVKAIAKGTATITATAQDGSGKKATCKITVKQPVTKVALNTKAATIKKNKTVTLKATVAPSNASSKAVTWKSSNPKVATVSSKGVVKGIKKGTVTITCTAKDGSKKKATCKVTVK